MITTGKKQNDTSANPEKRLRDWIVEAIKNREDGTPEKLADAILDIVKLRGDRETRHGHCPACKRDFKTMFDFPRVCIVKVTLHPVPAVVHGSTVDVYSRNTGNIASNILKAIKSDRMKQYLESIGDNIGYVKPSDMQPPFCMDKFLKTFPVPEMPPFHLVFREGEKNNDGYRTTKLVICSADLRTESYVELLDIATIIYNGMLDTASIHVTEDRDDLKKQIEQFLAEDDKPLKCPSCGNAKEFRFFTYNNRFDVADDGTVIVHGSYLDKDIADMDDIIVHCAKCGKEVIDSLW